MIPSIISTTTNVMTSVGGHSMMNALGGICPYIHSRMMMSTSSSGPSQHTKNKDHPTSLTPENAKDFFEKCPFAGVVEENIKQGGDKGLQVLSNLITSPDNEPTLSNQIDQDELKQQLNLELEKRNHQKDLKKMTYEDNFQSLLTGLKDEGRYRVFTTIQRQVGSYPYAKKFNNVDYQKEQPQQQEQQPSMMILQQEEVNVEFQEDQQGDVAVWCSNDYLGMGQHNVVINAMTESIHRMGAGSGGTRNISGTTSEHVRLEQELADLHHKDRALVFGSCYVANVNTITSLASALPNAIIFSDAKNHASLIEGIRNSRLEKYVFRHNDVEHLEQLLKSVPDQSRPKIVIFESVYSMDGTVAPIEAICNVADRYNALTFIDEVHAVGLYGARGAGVCERDGLMNRVDIVSGTLGKAFGVYGGYIASSSRIIDMVRCLSPGFIFTTSLPPAIVAGARASVSYLKQSRLEREQHRNRTEKLKQSLRDAHLPLMETTSHIVPLIVGDSARCKQMSDYLMAKHRIYVQPINYPTVPKGTERFRLTPSPVHDDNAITKLVQAMVDCWKQFNLQFTNQKN